jgi:hypothetical protein
VPTPILPDVRVGGLVSKDIEVIAARMGITIHDMTEPMFGVEQYTNRSFTDGSDVWLGKYDVEEFRRISFFHEVGHVIGAGIPYDEYPYFHYDEAMAWKAGLLLAATEGIFFSHAALQWARGCLFSYFGDNHPEKTPFRFWRRALTDSMLVDGQLGVEE